jgi:hypothetical protein
MKDASLEVAHRGPSHAETPSAGTDELSPTAEGEHPVEEEK